MYDKFVRNCDAMLGACCTNNAATLAGVSVSAYSSDLHYDINVFKLYGKLRPGYYLPTMVFAVEERELSGTDRTICHFSIWLPAWEHNRIVSLRSLAILMSIVPSTYM